MSRRPLVTVGFGLIMLASVTVASAKPNQAFLTDAIQGNLAEISMGQLAQKNGGSDGVRSFGQMLVQDHSAANEKAKTLAQAQGVTPPTAPKPESKTEFDRLSKLNGDAFDKEFAKHMVADHKEDIAEFEAQAKGSDEVASFAKDTLPTLQKHLQTAQSLTSGTPAGQ
jgi:putative membrane protein